MPNHTRAATTAMPAIPLRAPLSRVVPSPAAMTTMPSSTARSSTASRGTKNHQWGRRSSSTVSFWFRSFVGYGTAAQRSPGGSPPAEIVQAVVVDPEVVGDLVHDGDLDLLDQLLLGRADLAQGQPVDLDPVGHRQVAIAPVPLTPLGQRDPVVAAEEARLGGL